MRLMFLTGGSKTRHGGGRESAVDWVSAEAGKPETRVSGCLVVSLVGHSPGPRNTSSRRYMAGLGEGERQTERERHGSTVAIASGSCQN